MLVPGLIDQPAGTTALRPGKTHHHQPEQRSHAEARHCRHRAGPKLRITLLHSRASADPLLRDQQPAIRQSPARPWLSSPAAHAQSLTWESVSVRVRVKVCPLKSSSPSTCPPYPSRPFPYLHPHLPPWTPSSGSCFLFLLRPKLSSPFRESLPEHRATRLGGPGRLSLSFLSSFPSLIPPSARVSSCEGLAVNRDLSIVQIRVLYSPIAVFVVFSAVFSASFDPATIGRVTEGKLCRYDGIAPSWGFESFVAPGLENQSCCNSPEAVVGRVSVDLLAAATKPELGGCPSLEI